jgi:hypothetical protein
MVSRADTTATVATSDGFVQRIHHSSQLKPPGAFNDLIDRETLGVMGRCL